MQFQQPTKILLLLEHIVSSIFSSVKILAAILISQQGVVHRKIVRRAPMSEGLEASGTCMW